MLISDWSSDVCSSDLQAPLLLGRVGIDPFGLRFFALREALDRVGFEDALVRIVAIRTRAVAQRERDALQDRPVREHAPREARLEIGRASCRERVCQYV